MRVAFLGLGRMGSPMARHVRAAGHDLVVWNRTPNRAGDLVSAGAREAGSVARAVSGADAVVLMLHGPESVRAVLDEVLAAARPGLLLVDSTTVGPTCARECGARAAARDVRYVEAPVAGTVGPAREGTLAVFAGGAVEDVAAARPLLECWGHPARIRHVGPVGSGNALKLVVNLCLGVAIDGVGEALRLATDLGVDRSVALESLAAGPFGWTLAQKRAMIESGVFEPVTFSLELLDKDLRLALDEASRELAAVRAARQAARQAIAAGRGEEDYAALAGFLEAERA